MPSSCPENRWRVEGCSPVQHKPRCGHHFSRCLNPGYQHDLLLLRDAEAVRPNTQWHNLSVPQSHPPDNPSAVRDPCRPSASPMSSSFPKQQRSTLGLHRASKTPPHPRSSTCRACISPSLPPAPILPESQSAVLQPSAESGDAPGPRMMHTKCLLGVIRWAMAVKAVMTFLRAVVGPVAVPPGCSRYSL